MIDIENWLQEYKKQVNNCFGNRVIFIGLQGSYARKEASENSDIDVVLILDKVNIYDLEMYRILVAKLPHRNLLCGFISGRDELACWSEHDLFQFCFDTVALQGNLETIVPRLTIESAKQAALIGACNIYHACSHNFLHGQDIDALRMLYKSVFFVMQAHYYYKTGVYIRSRKEMQEMIEAKDSRLLQTLLNPAVIDQNNLMVYSQLLLEWAGILICQYGKSDHYRRKMSVQIPPE